MISTDRYSKHLETHHWWWRSRRALVESLLAGQHDLRILEVGCGLGGNLPVLATHGQVVGLDIAGQPPLLGDAESLPFREGAFDLVVCMDVLEHLDDDLALEEMAEVLKPGGELLVTVPASPRLWSDHDRALGHRRRYTRPGLRGLLLEHGFEPVFLSYFAAALYPIALVQRRRQLWNGLEWAPPRWVNGLLQGYMALERFWLKDEVWGSLPFGTSLYALARSAPEHIQPRRPMNEMAAGNGSLST